MERVTLELNQAAVEQVVRDYIAGREDLRKDDVIVRLVYRQGPPRELVAVASWGRKDL